MRPFSLCQIVISSLCLTLASGAAGSEPKSQTFDHSTLCIQSQTQNHSISVEVASTPEQRAFGLMERTWLQADSGMLFLYPAPQPKSHGLWMYRTRIPLDAAFIGADGQILRIQSMEPCLSSNRRECTVYHAGVEYMMALEVNQGFFEERGIQVGDKLLGLNNACPSANNGASANGKPEAKRQQYLHKDPKDKHPD